MHDIDPAERYGPGLSVITKGTMDRSLKILVSQQSAHGVADAMQLKLKRTAARW